MLLELCSTIKNIPTKVNSSVIDIDKFDKVPEINAVIVLLKHIGVDADYLSDKGFMTAYMLFGRYLSTSKDKTPKFIMAKSYETIKQSDSSYVSDLEEELIK